VFVKDVDGGVNASMNCRALWSYREILDAIAFLWMSWFMLQNAYLPNLGNKQAHGKGALISLIACIVEIEAPSHKATLSQPETHSREGNVSQIGISVRLIGRLGFNPPPSINAHYPPSCYSNRSSHCHLTHDSQVYTDRVEGRPRSMRSASQILLRKLR
jgi:hypothetical protein